MSDNNPYHQQSDQSQYQQPGQSYTQQPAQGQSYTQQPGQGQYSTQQQYQPPSGPPPQQFQDQNPWSAQPSFNAPGRSGTFKEEDFVPSDERGEQREAIQEYELRKADNKEDRDLEQLAREFPSMDTSLVAAIYGDTKDVDQARRMLQELNTS